jgi:uncharacterized protein (DUF1778 family)
MTKSNHRAVSARQSGTAVPVVAKSYAADAERPSAVPENESIVLTARDWEAFLAAWEDVDRPRPRLEALVQRYRNHRLSDAG